MLKGGTFKSFVKIRKKRLSEFMNMARVLKFPAFADVIKFTSNRWTDCDGYADREQVQAKSESKLLKTYEIYHDGSILSTESSRGCTEYRTVYYLCGITKAEVACH